MVKGNKNLGEISLLLPSWHPMNKDIKRLIRKLDGNVIYLNKFGTDRKGIKKLIEFESESENDINLKCQRFIIPFKNIPLTNYYNCIKYFFFNKPKILITTDYLLSSPLKVLCFLKNIKLYYWNDSHAKDYKKTSFIRRTLDKFLLFGFYGYLHGCEGAKYLSKITYERSEFLPCINLEYIRDKSKKFMRNEPSEELKLIFVGHLNKRKGIDRLINILEIISKSSKGFTKKITCYVIGEGDYSFSKYNFKNVNIVKFGILNRDLLIEKMSTSHYILSLSRVEPMGAVVLEGIASGCRAIVSKEVGSKYDLLDYDAGCVLSFKESKIARGSIEILSNEFQTFFRGKSNQNSQEIANKYSLKTMKKVIKSLIKEY